MTYTNNFGPYTTGEEVASALKGEIEGKTILITGVSDDSLGGTAAFAIATAAPKLLILSARSPSRFSSITKTLRNDYPAIEIKTVSMDLSLLASVREAAEEVISWNIPIDVVINSAAIMANPYAVTQDGIESQFGVGHLAHFLFTNRLLAKGAVRDGGRVVNVASSGHRFGGVRFEDVNFSDGKVYNKWRAYGQVKTANMLYSLSLAGSPVLKKKGITSFSLQPGGIAETGLGRHIGTGTPEAILAQAMKEISAIEDEDGLPESKRDVVIKTKEQGVSTYLVAAFDPNLVEFNGSYLDDCKIREPLVDAAGDLEGAKKLWKLSEELVGEKFDFL